MTSAQSPPRTIAYLRVSTDKQELAAQKLEILSYANTHGFTVDDFLQIQISSRKSNAHRRIDELFERLQPGDTLVVAELSRLGRSVSQIVTMVDELIRRRVRFTAIKENINLVGDGTKDIQTTVMTTLFSLFAEMERTLISERTKAGLQAARARGSLIGRPKGSKGPTKLDGKELSISEDLRFGIAKAALARKYGVSRTTIVHFIATRGLTGQST